MHGFSSFQPDVDIAGVVFNRIGSEGHRRILVEAMAPLEIPVLGCIPRTPDLALPEGVQPWAPASPRRYRLRVELVDAGGRALDRVDRSVAFVGIRAKGRKILGRRCG